MSLFFKERQIDFKVVPCGCSLSINYELTIETPYIECSSTWNDTGLCPFKNFTYLEFYFWLIQFTNCLFPPRYRSLHCQALLLLPLISLYLFYFTNTVKNWLPCPLKLLFRWPPHSPASFWPSLTPSLQLTHPLGPRTLGNPVSPTKSELAWLTL